MRNSLEKHDGLFDWRVFAESWSGMSIDKYMADGGTYRRRRYSVFSTCAATKEPELEPSRPHFQPLTCNAANGGINRWYEPFSTGFIGGAPFQAILQEARTIFERLWLNRTWHVEAHQIRVEASAETLGKPTPEGIHRDGVEFALIMMIDRTNVINGETTIYPIGDGGPIERFTLRHPLECLLFVDSKVRHGVSSIAVRDSAWSGKRDILVLTFRTNRPTAAGLRNTRPPKRKSMPPATRSGMGFQA